MVEMFKRIWDLISIKLNHLIISTENFCIATFWNWKLKILEWNLIIFDVYLFKFLFFFASGFL